MAHGRKRILGGKMLVEVGVVLGAVMVASCWWPVIDGGTNLVVGIKGGVVGVKYYTPAIPLPMDVVSMFFKETPLRMTWWITRPDPNMNVGVLSILLCSQGPSLRWVDAQVLLWPPALLAIMAGAALWRLGFVARRRWKNAEHVCPACGYARVGLPETAPCPECGGVIKRESEG